MTESCASQCVATAGEVDRCSAEIVPALKTEEPPPKAEPGHGTSGPAKCFWVVVGSARCNDCEKPTRTLRRQRAVASTEPRKCDISRQLEALPECDPTGEQRCASRPISFGRHQMKHPLRNSASGLASFLAATLLLAQPALAAYCYSPIRGPYISADAYCRVGEGIQITRQQYSDRLAR
jgi:hypothetical protein